MYPFFRLIQLVFSLAETIYPVPITALGTWYTFTVFFLKTVVCWTVKMIYQKAWKLDYKGCFFFCRYLPGVFVYLCAIKRESLLDRVGVFIHLTVSAADTKCWKWLSSICHAHPPPCLYPEIMLGTISYLPRYLYQTRAQAEHTLLFKIHNT